MKGLSVRNKFQRDSERERESFLGPKVIQEMEGASADKGQVKNALRVY